MWETLSERESLRRTAAWLLDQSTEKDGSLHPRLFVRTFLTARPDEDGECWRELGTLKKQTRLIAAASELGLRAVEFRDALLGLFGVIAEDHEIPLDKGKNLNQESAALARKWRKSFGLGDGGTLPLAEIIQRCGPTPALAPVVLPVGSEPAVPLRGRLLVVDDDLARDDTLCRLLERRFAGRVEVVAIAGVAAACERLARDKEVIGCITDVVFRSPTGVDVAGGAAVASAALERGVDVVVFTGHARRDIGAALRELEKLGIPAADVVRKPETVDQTRAFVERIHERFAR